MTTKITLLTSQGVYESLHELADRSRKWSVMVDRQVLLDLLIDHSVLCAALTGVSGIKIVNPEPPRTRLRLK